MTEDGSAAVRIQMDVKMRIHRIDEHRRGNEASVIVRCCKRSSTYDGCVRFMDGLLVNPIREMISGCEQREDDEREGGVRGGGRRR